MSDDPDRTVFRPVSTQPSRTPATGWERAPAWQPGPAPSPAWGRPAPDPVLPPEAVPDVARGGPRRKPHPAILALGAGLALAVAVAGAILLWPEAEEMGAAAPAAAPGATAPPQALPAPESPQAAVLAALPAIDCSWLNLTNATGEAGSLGLFFNGAAGRPVLAQNQIEAAAERAGGRVAQLDFTAVAQINSNLCNPIQSFSLIRDGGPQRMSMPAQSVWEIAPQQLESEYGRIYAQPLIDVNIGNPSQDFAIFGLEGAAGTIAPIIGSRAQFDGIDSVAITRLPNDRFRLNLATDHPGWSGILLVTGRPPFEADLFAPDGGGRAEWSRRFAARARERGWKTEMLWYKVVDELPNEEDGLSAPLPPAASEDPAPTAPSAG